MPSKDMELNSTDSPHVNYLEEEKPLLQGIKVRAATPDRLLHLCIQSFDNNGKLIEDTKYPQVLFLMHKWFMQSQELAESLIHLYQTGETAIVCSSSTCRHTPAEYNCEKQRYKAKICHGFRYWIRTCPVHFDLDRRLSSVVEKFGEMLQAEGNTAFTELIDLSKIPSYDWMRSMSTRNPSVKHSRKVSLVFNHLKPEELAEQLTHLEYKVFRRINVDILEYGDHVCSLVMILHPCQDLILPLKNWLCASSMLFTDYKNYAVTASLKDNQKLERSISLFNGLSQWVQCMVLSRTTPAQRSEVIIKFIDVSKRLQSLQNFNTLMAVVGGLTHSALARLSKTNACLSSDKQKTLMEFTELLSSNNNFSNYRKIFAQCTGFRIPILGVHLKDLISLHTALTDKVEGASGSLVNFRKIVQLFQIFKVLTKLQSMSVPVDANIDLVNTIRLSLDLHYTEDEIYELSLAREPRNSLSSPSTPTKPVVFADWAAGVSPPDHETINKHVHDMVEAVFKNYDHDKDGFICNAEFEAIAGNFPFIDSFCVLDADKDGMISKSEMKTYFIRANSHAMKNSFKHDFHETTYFKPTFCIHCTGLLWGLIKQGWKCKDCGINAHKLCKDLVVMECRSKINPHYSRRSDSVSGESGSQECRTYTSKRKLSQNHRRSRSNQATQTDDDLFTDSPASSPKNKGNHINGEEFYEDQPMLYDQLIKAEETREKLMEENAWLRARLDISNEQILTLKSQLSLIRQHTISFILNQMDTLHMQRDTEV